MTGEPATIAIRGGRVIDPARGLDAEADVLVMYGLVADVAPKITRRADREIDARGLVVAPGLVDIHVHLREPGLEGKETIATGSRAAVAGGFTTICAMPNTEPPLDTRAACEFVRDEGHRAGCARVLPIGCVTKGRKGEELAELADLVQGGACAFSDDGFPVRRADVMRRALRYAGMLGRVVIDHCEDLELASGGLMHEGLVSLALGLPGKPASSEDVLVARDVLLAESEGARVHIAHISTARSLEIVRAAKARGVRVSCEATPHHLVLTDAACRDFDPAKHKMNPPLREAADVAALRRGLADGTIDAIASDHAPHAREEKEREWALAPDGVVGLETTLPIVVTELVEAGVIPLARAIELMTVGPARALGLAGGTLAPGQPADVAVLDLATPYAVRAADLRTKGRNTPFDGAAVRGRARAVLVGGKIVHEA
jgi:dihydroorotase